MNDFWTLWILGRDGYWVAMESFSRRADAEAAAADYRGHAVQLRDPADRVRWERII